MQAEANPEFDTHRYRFSYQSLITPPSVFDYDVDGARARAAEATGGARRLRPDALPGPSALHADGAPTARGCPISLVYRKGSPRDGRSPLLLTGYGAYGIACLADLLVEPAQPAGSRRRLRDRPHARRRRAGQARGTTTGRMLQKRNTFTDFIAGAEHLVGGSGWTSPRPARHRGRQRGRAADGRGGEHAARPVPRRAVSDVPFVDVINTMLDASLPLTVGEFEEWGNPKIREQYDYMRTYCPYTNLAERPYPAMLVRTSLNDSQVMYWEPAKYVAQLRALKTRRNPLLLQDQHGGGPRRRVGPLRLPPRDRLRLRMVAGRGRPRGVSAGPGQAA